jgi:hypothetical protein
MKRKRLYAYDLLRNPRSSEDSRIVVAYWGTPEDGYDLEQPQLTDGNAVARADYYALSAERLLYRGKVLGLPIDDAFATNETLQRAHPFGQGGPGFSELNNPAVSLAMAFVPLTPEGSSGKPELVRLYCVKGLAFSYSSPFADGSDLPALASYSWFVAGLPDKIADKSINGRSWLLAAYLLKAVLGRNQAASTKKNLATSFIVTGDVENGNIRPVEMGRKPELAKYGVYSSLKWIIPMKNSNDMNSITSHLVEKPATLEEALDIIAGRESIATREFWTYLEESERHEIDLGRLQHFHNLGADLFSEQDGKSPIQVVSERIERTRLGINAIDVLLETEKVFEKHNGVSSPCKTPVSESIQRLRESVKELPTLSAPNPESIAVRWGDPWQFFNADASRQIAREHEKNDFFLPDPFYGERKRGLCSLDRAKLWLESQGTNCAKTFAMLARNGLNDAIKDLATRFPINARDENGFTAIDWALIWGEFDAARLLYSFGGSVDAKEICKIWRRREELYSKNMVIEDLNDLAKILVFALSIGLNPEGTSLFFNALFEGYVDLISACLDAGCDPNAEFSGYCGSVSSRPNPIFIAAENIADAEKQQAIIELLRKHGVTEEKVSEEELKHAKARSFVNFGKTPEIVKALEEGILSVGERFINWDDGDEQNDYNQMCEREEELAVSCYMSAGKVRPRTIENLFVRSLRLGWLDVVEWCLKNGISPVGALECEVKSIDDYPFAFGDDTPSITFLEKKPKVEKGVVYPSQFVKAFTVEREKDVLDLLKDYIPKDPTSPPEAMPEENYRQ